MTTGTRKPHEAAIRSAIRSRAADRLFVAEKELLCVAASQIADAQRLLRQLRLDQFAETLETLLKDLDHEFYKDFE